MQYDLTAFAILMDRGPVATYPTSSDRARVSTSLEQCFDYATTMTAKARRDIYIRLDDGGIITAREIEVYLASRP